MSKSNPIFDVLNCIDTRKIERFEDIEADYNPYMTMRWMAACKDANRITRVNGLLNVVTFNLHADKKLLYYLSCALSDGNTKRYQWINKYKEDKTKNEIISMYFDITPREARTVHHLYNGEDLLEMAEELGYNEKELKKLQKSFIKNKNDT